MTPMELYFASRWGCYALGCCFHVGSDKDSIFIICSNGMKNIEFVFYSYHIFIAYTSISEWGPVVMYGFDCFLFVYRLRRIFAEMILWLKDTPSKEEFALQSSALFLEYYLGRYKSIVFTKFFGIKCFGIKKTVVQ